MSQPTPYPPQSQQPYQPPAPAPKKRRKWPWIVSGLVVLIIVIVSVASGGNKTPEPTAAATAVPSIVGTTVPRAANDGYQPTWTTAPATPPVTTETSAPAPAAPQIPYQVQLAMNSAQSYLSLSAFSRNGLIRQLSSQAGEGYPKDVATDAVDRLNVDWNQQAVKSAQQYLDMTSFSCSGLIQQLSSSAGEGFTQAQATYGAHQTPACK
ncbi:hypothetical protein HFP15_13520 [Amycolatopsis sp. K13G38]|uniref:Putative host cell surface-exposed lipoprotein Ltp-like HTH region domain-containing protein n=1 Tax=Amycolatopsis acididurans TaxID=2724524 RepID=A0ABX1J6A6_9PSEU|nr:Ltp family lipoprotein [Amycolatopsis acididurans]NKQ53900.1 hypothetical protein [Amycolatopsis acididurans]